MNPNARINCVEVLYNDAELSSLTHLCKSLGVAKSTFLRDLSNKQIREHSKPLVMAMESRRCPGVGKQASRSARVGGMRRLF